MASGSETAKERAAASRSAGDNSGRIWPIVASRRAKVAQPRRAAVAAGNADNREHERSQPPAWIPAERARSLAAKDAGVQDMRIGIWELRQPRSLASASGSTRGRPSADVRDLDQPRVTQLGGRLNRERPWRPCRPVLGGTSVPEQVFGCTSWFGRVAIETERGNVAFGRGINANRILPGSKSSS